MEPTSAAMMIAPMMMTYMMSSVAPIAMMMSGGEVDRERMARGLAQFSIVSMRSVMEITYDDMLLDDRTGDFSVRGIEITLPEAAGVPGCTIKVDALTIVSLDRPNVLSVSSEADGITIDPACAADKGPMILSMLGPDAMNMTHYSATTSYHLGDSSLDYSMLVETAAAGSVSVNAQLEGLHLEQSDSGDPQPSGEITQLEITVQDTDALRELLPILGLDNDPVAMATGTMTGVLSKDGISPEEQALIDSANTELARVVNDGGSVTLRSSPGVSVSFKELQDTDGPEDLVAMMQPVFSAALVGADNLIPSALLNMAMTAPGDMSEADQLRVAQALATGEGAPRSVRTAAAMLKPLADGGNADAALHYASLLQAEGTNPDGAYEYALIAGKGGAAGVRSVLDHIESDLSIQSILDLQAAAAGELPAPEADMSALRNGARQYAHGRGATRNYGRAMLLATLAAAGGDHNSHLLVERLSKRFADDEDADVWRAMEATQAETALRLWAEGFGDGFGAQ